MEIDEVYAQFAYTEADLPTLAQTMVSESLINDFNAKHLRHPKPSKSFRGTTELRSRIKAAGSVEAFVDTLIERRCFLSKAVRNELTVYLTSPGSLTPILRKKVFSADLAPPARRSRQHVNIPRLLRLAQPAPQRNGRRFQQSDSYGLEAHRRAQNHGHRQRRNAPRSFQLLQAKLRHRLLSGLQFSGALSLPVRSRGRGSFLGALQDHGRADAAELLRADDTGHFGHRVFHDAVSGQRSQTCGAVRLQKHRFELCAHTKLHHSVYQLGEHGGAINS